MKILIYLLTGFLMISIAFALTEQECIDNDIYHYFALDDTDDHFDDDCGHSAMSGINSPQHITEDHGGCRFGACVNLTHGANSYLDNASYTQAMHQAWGKGNFSVTFNVNHYDMSARQFYFITEEGDNDGNLIMEAETNGMGGWGRGEFGGQTKQYSSAMNQKALKWECFMFRHNGTHLGIYNTSGMIAHQTTGTDLDTGANPALGFGSHTSHSATYSMDGMVDDIAIFNRTVDIPELIDICDNGINATFTSGPPADTTAPTVAITAPKNNTRNNSYYWMNVSYTVDELSNCTLWVNNSYKAVENNTDVSHTMPFYVYDYDHEDWELVVGCTDPAGNSGNSSTFLVYYDKLKPAILHRSNNFYETDNSTALDNTTLNLQINVTCTDKNLYRAQWNMTNGSHVIFSHYMTDFNFTDALGRYNITDSISTANLTHNKTYYVYEECTDDHTIKFYHTMDVQKQEKSITFDGDVTIELVTPSSVVSKITYEKLEDRYTFEFDTDDKAKTYQVICNGKIYRRHFSNYKGHFVCEANSGESYWIDFENEEKAEVLVYESLGNWYISTSGKTFKSIGGLNSQINNYRFTFSTQTPPAEEVANTTTPTLGGGGTPFSYAYNPSYLEEDYHLYTKAFLTKPNLENLKAWIPFLIEKLKRDYYDFIYTIKQKWPIQGAA